MHDGPFWKRGVGLEGYLGDALEHRIRLVESECTTWIGLAETGSRKAIVLRSENDPSGALFAIREVEQGAGRRFEFLTLLELLAGSLEVTGFDGLTTLPEELFGSAPGVCGQRAKQEPHEGKERGTNQAHGEEIQSR